MVVREAETIIGSVITWHEKDTGIIEDVFVKEPWRQRGIANYLLIHALTHLRGRNLNSARLMVLTSNQPALSLYISVGFQIIKEEIRYFTPLS